MTEVLLNEERAIKSAHTVGEIKVPPKRSSAQDIALQPVQAIFLEISFRTRKGMFELKYKKIAVVELPNPLTSQAEFETRVKAFCTGYPTNDPQDWKSPRNEPKYHSALSVKADKPSFVAVRLLEKDDGTDVTGNKNWQYARVGPPITVATTGFGQAFDPARAFPNDVIIYEVPSQGNPEPEYDVCNVACFVYIPDAVGEAFRKSLDFNLHVEILDGNKHVPIIIDPDVGWPGGNKP